METISTMTISGSTRVSVPADILMQDLGGEAVFLNLSGGSYFGLDEVGTRMWKVLTTAPCVQAAFDILVAEYEVEPEQLRKDLFDLIDKLVEQQLLNLEGTPAA
jgi:hypothetical protein